MVPEVEQEGYPGKIKEVPIIRIYNTAMLAKCRLTASSRDALGTRLAEGEELHG